MVFHWRSSDSKSPQVSRTVHLLRAKPSPPTSVLDVILNNVDEAPVMLQLWGMQNTPSLLSLPSSLWPEVVAPERVPSFGKAKLFDYLNWVQTND